MKSTRFAMMLVAALCLMGLAFAQPVEKIKDMGIDQKLDNQIPLNLQFQDETGKSVTLGDYFNKGKPVLIVPVFYQCQGICRVTLEGLLQGFKGMRTYNVGNDFNCLVISIHPKETPLMANKTRIEMLEAYDRLGASQGWHFLVGKQEMIAPLMGSLGFKYVYNEAKDAINHPAAAMILTPSGHISSYFVDVVFPSKMLRDRLIVAGEDKIGVKSEQKLFGCLSVDPKTGALTVNIMRVLTILCAITAISVFGAILFLSIRHRRTRIDPTRPAVGGSN